MVLKQTLGVLRISQGWNAMMSIDHNTLLTHCKVASQPGQNGRMQIKLYQLFHKSSMVENVKCLLEVKKYTAYF